MDQKSYIENIANYKLIELIGKGGMSLIYLAEDIRLKRTVAIKIIKAPNAQQSQNIAMHEAQILAQLNHVNIVQVFDVIPHDNHVVMIMEYVNGRNLYQMQKECKPSLVQKINWLIQISAALIEAHNNQVIHCDLKLSNIIITENAQVKVADFGIARLASYSQMQTVNFGSKATMSPEQRAGKKIDFRSDLWSLGHLAFTLISGHSPVSHDKDSLPKSNIGNAKIMNAYDITPSIPNDLAALLNQLLEFNKHMRPETAQLVAYKLQQIKIALCQKEIFEQETAPFVPLKETGLRLVCENIRKKPMQGWLTALFILVIVPLFIANTLWPSPTLSYIAVLRPTISEGSEISDIHKSLTIAALDQTIRDMVLNAKNMRLIPRSETDNLTNNIKQIGIASGATEIISSQVDCSRLNCYVTLSRLQGNKWLVHSQKQWPIPFMVFKEIRKTTQFHFAQLFPESSEYYLNKKRTKDSDYSEYIELYAKTMVQGKAAETDLEQLTQLLQRSPYLYSAYSLYREISLELYYQTKNPRFIAQLETLLALSPPEYQYSVFHSIDSFWVLLHTAKTEAIENKLNEAKDRGADDLTLLKLKAGYFFNHNRYAEALHNYNLALDLRPSTALLYNIALSYWWLGDIANAKKTLEKLLAIIPYDYASNQLMASIFLLEGDILNAKYTYEKLVKQNENSLDLNNLALVYSLLGDNVRALEFVKKAVAKAPTNPTWLLNLADVEFLLGNTTQALTYYQKVIQLHLQGKNLKAWLEKAQAYVHLGEVENAIKSLNQAKKIASDNGEVAFTAALVYAQIGENVSAIVQVEETLKLKTGVIWFNLPWFDSLCQSQSFIFIMENANNGERCNKSI